MRPLLAFATLLAVCTLTPAHPLVAQDAQRTYFEFQVTTPVRQAPGSKAPRYPAELKSAGVEGDVLAQFVVDTMGIADLGSFRVLKSSHGLFSDAVLAALPDMRFTPAEVAGRKVRQLVQQPFVFGIQGSGFATGAAARTAAPSPLPSASAAGSRIAPAPPTGTVDGWIVERRQSVDSGNGTPAIMLIRLVVAGSRARIEMNFPSRPNAAMIVDTASDRWSMVSAANMTVVEMVRAPAGSPRIRVEQLSPPVKARDFGAAERVAGVPTRHYRSEGLNVARATFGNRSCVLERPLRIESWRTRDAAMGDGIRQSNHVLLHYAWTLPIQNLDSLAAESSAPGVAVRTMVVTRGTRPDGGTFDITTTSEVTRFSREPVAAALFEPPEGYRVLDLSRALSPAQGDSVVARIFAQLVDSTTTGAGRTTRCTVTPAP